MTVEEWGGWKALEWGALAYRFIGFTRGENVKDHCVSDGGQITGQDTVSGNIRLPLPEKEWGCRYRSFTGGIVVFISQKKENELKLWP